MAGRHRAPAPSRSKPMAIGTIAVSALGTTFWLATSLGAGADDRPIQAAAPSVPSVDPTTTSAKATTTSQPTPTTTRSTSRSSTPKPTPTTTRRSPQPAPRTHTQSTSRPAPVQACPTALDGTQPHVARVGHHLLGKFDVSSVIGRAARSGASDHPTGIAIDFMVDTPTGDALADYVLSNQARFGVKYVIWRQRYNDGGGWSMMSDRGSTTANHYDHVHVSLSVMRTPVK